MVRRYVLVVCSGIQRKRAAERALCDARLLPVWISSLQAVRPLLAGGGADFADALLRDIAGNPSAYVRGMLIDDAAPLTVAACYASHRDAKKTPTITGALVDGDVLLQKIPVVLCLTAAQWEQSVVEQLPSGWPRADTSGNTAEQWRAACNLLLNTTSVGD